MSYWETCTLGDGVQNGPEVLTTRTTSLFKVISLWKTWKRQGIWEELEKSGNFELMSLSKIKILFFKHFFIYFFF